MDTQAWFDQVRAETTKKVRRHGWMVQYVGTVCDCPGCEGGSGDSPSFAYTVGLFGLGHPELLIFGLEPEPACTVLNTFGEMVRRGENLLPGQLVIPEGSHHQFLVEEVPNPGEIVFSANDFYDRPSEASVPVLQLTYDDGTGVFPWDPGHPNPAIQPRPGTFQA